MDVSRQAAFFDESIRPHARQELVFGDQSSMRFDQRQERVEDLGLEGQKLVAGPEQALRPIQPKPLEQKELAERLQIGH